MPAPPAVGNHGPMAVIEVSENSGLHAQLLTQARDAGVLEERQRMAREIHDTLARGLAGIITQLEAAQQARAQADRGGGGPYGGRLSGATVYRPSRKP